MDFEFLNLPYQSEKWLALVRYLFGDAFQAALTPMQVASENERVDAFVQHGVVQLNDTMRTRINVYALELKPGLTKVHRNRVMLATIVEKIRSDAAAAGALAVFADPGSGKWRLTLVAKRDSYTASGALSTQQTEPKRFTYLLGKDENTRTARQRFEQLAGKYNKKYDDVLEAFSVEPINQEFFKKYKQHYLALCEELYEHARAQEIFTADTKLASKKLMRDFAKRLMGRLVFLCFLQKKGWLGQEPEFISRLFKESKAPDHFYSNELRRLFFQTLNTKRDNDTFSTPWGNVQIPYLNGGLFDNELKETEQLNFSADWFSQVFEFFSQYNFTVDETSPLDHEVGIDPEMLGHIFENLLEENREKGAIYTPKEIVHFMCQQSLSEYLIRKFEGWLDPPVVRSLVMFKSVAGVSKTQLNEILSCLDNIKICDPAIGSGAFPMGMLLEIYGIKEAIYLETKGLKAIAPAKLKTDIIQNSIFGVDIDPGAVDIARLRFWLSLVVEEDTPQTLPNLDYKIMQGNSLLECFEGIELSNLLRDNGNGTHKGAQTQLFEVVEEPLVQFGEKEKVKLSRWIDQFFSPGQNINKTELQSKINQLITTELNETIRRYKVGLLIKAQELGKAFSKVSVKQLKEIDRLEAEIADCESKQIRLAEWQQKSEKPYFLWHTWFKEVFDKKGGFDIVIANPPYMRVQEIEKSFPAEKKQYEQIMPDGKQRYEVATAAYDLANLFFELTVKKLTADNPDAVNCFIFPHKFFNAGGSEAFRDFLLQGRYIDKIAHFGANRVFNDVDTYVCIALFSPRHNDGFLLQKFPFGANFKRDMLDESRYQWVGYKQLQKASELHGSNQWIFFEVEREYELFYNVYQNVKKLESVFQDIFQGIATSNDKLYICDLADYTSEHYYMRNQLSEKIWPVEKKYFKPMLKGRDVHRFEQLQTNAYVFFPYDIHTNEKGKNMAEPVALEHLKTHFPLTFQFVIEQEAEFKARERGKAATMKYWYEYIYPKNLVKFEQRRLSSMEICTSHPNVTLNEGSFYHNTKVYSWVKSESTWESYEYLLAIANSSVLWWFLKNTGDTLQGDARTLKTTYLNPFPIPQTVSERDEAAIACLTKYILWLNAGQTTGLSISNDAVAQYFRHVLDACVCELYFGDEMRAQNVALLEYVARDLGSVGDIESARVAALYRAWQAPDSEVRNRVTLLPIRCANSVGIILKSTNLNIK
jgi:adenine-specific DNA-methyltransferase